MAASLVCVVAQSGLRTGADAITDIPPDPFSNAREQFGAMILEAGEEQIPVVLRHADVRRAAKDYETFSSDTPFRVPIPSEEAFRSVRQLPIEIDPPLHKTYRKLLEPWFIRPTRPEYIARVDHMIEDMLAKVGSRDRFETVREFALPIQSHALTFLLEMPECEAAIWERWSTSLFHEGDSEGKGRALESYLREQLARARSNSRGEDFFTFLTDAKIDGRPLSDDEILGIGNLTFAGGRDTVISTISVMLEHFSVAPRAMRKAAASSRETNLAVEEFVRAISPLTLIGRTCPHGAQVGDKEVEPGGRAALCWASANYDRNVFDEPEEIHLDRSPNPHLGFGSGHHSCLGSQQARAIMRSLIGILAAKVESIKIFERKPRIEANSRYRRAVGYDRLVATVTLRRFRSA